MPRSAHLHGPAHHVFHALLAVGLGGLLLAAVLGLHVGWIHPITLGVGGIVLAHVVLFGAVAVAVRHLSHRHQGGGHEAGGEIIFHHSHRYDRLVRLLTLGREGRLRGWMLDLAEVHGGDAALDVGCGTGTLLLAAAARVGPEGLLRGVEPAPAMRARAIEKTAAAGVDVKVVDGSAGALPFEPASFDAVFCTLVLHHLPDAMRPEAVREIARVLRPGGRALIVDWQHPGSLTAALTDPMALAFLLHGVGGRASPLDDMGIVPLMEELGFVGVERRTWGGGSLTAVLGRMRAAEPEKERP